MSRADLGDRIRGGILGTLVEILDLVDRFADRCQGNRRSHGPG